MKLTQRIIEGLTCPPGKKDKLHSDDDQLGLYVRVTENARAGLLDAKNFVVQYSINGKKPRIALGSCAALALSKAREAARAIMGDVAKGIDPAAERKRAALDAKIKAQSEALTLDSLLAQWQAIHLTSRRPSYAAEAVRALRYAFAKHLDQPAADITRENVVRVIDGLKQQDRPAMAASTKAYGRAAYSWAVKRGSLTSNPFLGLPAETAAARERVLSDDELLAIWKATAEPGPFNAIVRMLTLTGQRREEVAAMTWAEIAADLSMWTIPAVRAKNGIVHIVPLSPQAQAVLAASPRTSDLLFPGLRGPFSGFGKAKARLDATCAVNNWRLHDLRRTMATGLQRLGVRLEVTEAVLGHIAGSRAGIIGVYQRHEYAAEKRAALTAWGEHVAAIVEERDPAGNVTTLRQLAGAHA